MFFSVFNGQISIHKLTKQFVLDYFAEKKKRQNFQFLTKNHGLTLFGKMPHFRLSESMFFFSIKWLDFDLHGQKILHFKLSFQKTRWKKLLIRTKNWRNAKFSTFLNDVFFSLKWLVCSPQGHKTLWLGQFFTKTKSTKFLTF